jgi:hypothetical protein
LPRGGRARRVVGCAAIAWGLATLVPRHTLPPDVALRTTFISVGHGLSVLVEEADGPTWLFVDDFCDAFEPERPGLGSFGQLADHANFLAAAKRYADTTSRRRQDPIRPGRKIVESILDRHRHGDPNERARFPARHRPQTCRKPRAAKRLCNTILALRYSIRFACQPGTATVRCAL